MNDAVASRRITEPGIPLSRYRRIVKIQKRIRDVKNIREKYFYDILYIQEQKRNTSVISSGENFEKKFLLR